MHRRFLPILPILLFWLGEIPHRARAADHDFRSRRSDTFDRLRRIAPPPLEESPLGTDFGSTDVVSQEMGYRSTTHTSQPSIERRPVVETDSHISSFDFAPPQPTANSDYPLASRSTDWNLYVLPNGLLYKPYLADPKESRMYTAMMYLPGHGWVWDSTLGARLGILRYGTPGSVRPQGWQLDLEGAVFPRLDVEQRDDLISADYRFGVPLTWSEGPLSVRFGYNHISSHLGDEFLLANPDAERLNYVQDGLVLGVSYYVDEDVRIYGDAAWAFSYEVARPWWFQFGMQYSPAGGSRLSPAPFFAVNSNLRQELGFRGAINAQTGWQWRGIESERVFRFGIQYYNGRSSQYSFFNRFAVGLAALEVLRHGDVHHAEHGLPEVAQVVVVLDDVALVLHADAAAAAEHGGQVGVVVGVDGAAARAPGHHRVVEQRAVAFLDRLQRSRK
jgi:hypothetical protein